jgi:hypothetical protein
MTDEGRGIGGIVGPPWSVDVLADLHAGVLEEREAVELWPRVNADPDARAIIEALNTTTADLAELATARSNPCLPNWRSGWTTRSRTKHGSGKAEPAIAPVASLNAAHRRNQAPRLGCGTRPQPRRSPPSSRSSPRAGRTRSTARSLSRPHRQNPP